MSSPSTAVGPVRGSERIHALDILRGVALLGIVVVNVAIFAGSPPVESTTDRITHNVVTFLFADKFYVLFAFLFGYGLAVQLERAAVSGVPLVPRFRRRLLFLFVIGLVHAVLLFYGDVLASYAVAGTVLLALRRLSARGAARAALGVLAGLAALYAVVALGMSFMDTMAGDPVSDAAEGSGAVAAYRGDLTDILGQRLTDFVGFAPLTLGLLLPNYIAIFLAGLAAGKRRLLHKDLPPHLLRRTLLFGLGIGIPGAVLSTTFPISGTIDPLTIAVRGTTVLTAPAFTAAYVAGLLLALRTRPGRRILSTFAAPGRLALSNYLGQSVCCAFLFTGYGFALMGTVNAMTAFGTGVAVFVVLAMASTWWGHRFEQGPVEWLLRTFTYWRRQPFRKKTGQRAER